jgi:hypothetical protein
LEPQPNTKSAHEWPRCPGCNGPRHTSCPVCQTAGSRFERAFEPREREEESSSEERGDKLLVLCPTCDEAFVPVFLARCEWCGHPFEDGRQTPLPALRTSPFAEMTTAAWIVLAGLVSFFAAVVGGFCYLRMKS